VTNRESAIRLAGGARMSHNREMLGDNPALGRAVLSRDTTAAANDCRLTCGAGCRPSRKPSSSATPRWPCKISLAGIRARHPNASDRECFLRLAALKLGADVVRAIYPDAEAFGIGT
jgi:hypothetical protein